MYNFTKIKRKVELIRFNFAQACVNVTNPIEFELCNSADEILENMIIACENEDIVMVKIFWNEFAVILAELNQI